MSDFSGVHGLWLCIDLFGLRRLNRIGGDGGDDAR